MWYELILYNPILWIVSLLFVSILFSHLYWYCKRNFELKGSWKNLDKSIHWKD